MHEHYNHHRLCEHGLSSTLQRMQRLPKYYSFPYIIFSKFESLRSKSAFDTPELPDSSCNTESFVLKFLISCLSLILSSIKSFFFHFQFL